MHTYIYIYMVSILRYICIYWYDGIFNQQYDLQTKLVMCTNSDDMMVYQTSIMIESIHGKMSKI